MQKSTSARPTARQLLAIAVYEERYLKAATTPQIFWDNCLTPSEKRNLRQQAEAIRQAEHE